MRTWDDYKNYVRSESRESGREIEECEELSRKINPAMKFAFQQPHEVNVSLLFSIYCVILV